VPKSKLPAGLSLNLSPKQTHLLRYRRVPNYSVYSILPQVCYF